jgi:SAM-dependent methyltransferase
VTSSFDPKDYWDERLRASYDLTGVGHRSYDATYNRWLYRRKGDRLRAALGPMPGGFRALDIGSGTGWVIEQLHAAGAAQVTGMDITETAVERLALRFPGDAFLRAAVGVDPLPPGPYDVVTAMDVLFHITDDATWAASLADIGAQLAPAGRLLLTDGLGPTDQVPAQHVRFRSLARYREAAEAAGLLVQTVEAYFSWLSRDRSDSVWSARLRGLEGPVLYALERGVPRTPHMRLTVLSQAKS